MGLFSQFALSYRMTVAAARMTFRYPQSILVALGNLAFLTVVAVAPLVFMIWLWGRDAGAGYEFAKYFYQFWIVDNTLPHNAAGDVTFSTSWDIGATVSAAILWFFVLYFLWATIVALGSLVTATIIMHTGVQQLRNQQPSIADGWALARRNFLRLLGLAVIAGALMTLVKRLLAVLRVVPVAGKWIQRAVAAAITFTLYMVLPVVVYERNGVWAGVKSTWENARKTWGGLAVGTGLILSALWVGLWFIGVMVRSVLEGVGMTPEQSWSTILILQVVAAVALYCINVALSANLRAALYLHVTEGHTGVLPEGALVPAQPQQPGAPAMQLSPR